MESQIYLANYPKLCLDPNSSISKTTHTITSNKQIFDTHRLRHSASNHSISSVKQKRKLGQFTSRPDLQLYSFMSNTRVGRTSSSASSSLSPPCKVPRKSLLLSSAGSSSSSGASTSGYSGEDPLRAPIPVPNLDAPLALAPPSIPTLITQFKAHTRLPDTSDCSPQLVETYVLETDIPTRTTDKAGTSTTATPGKRVYHIRLSILQRPSNGEYLGELYLDRDHKEGETNGVACKFSLGTSAHANRYIQQFTEIVTESGRKPIRINYGPAPELKDRVMQMLKQMPPHQQQLAQLQLQQQQQQQQQLQLQLQQQLIQNTQAKALSQQSTKELEINAIAAQLMTDTQQFQAAAYAKQQQQNREKQLQQQAQQQQQQHSSNNLGNNIAICNILNAPVISTSANAAAAAAAVATQPDLSNAGTTMLINHQLTPQQKAALNHKLINRKFTLQSLAGVPVTRNLLVNNNHYNHHHHHRLLGDLQAVAATAAAGQQQTITLANFTSIPIVPVQPQSQQQQQGVVTRVPVMSSGDGGKSALSALLDGTPSADRPGLMQNASSSLLLEKFSAVAAAAAAAANQTTSGPGASPTAGTHYIHSPKSILSPLSSPPPTATLTTPTLLSSTPSNTAPTATTIHHFSTSQEQQLSPEQQQQQLQLQAAFSQGPISLLATGSAGTTVTGTGGGAGSLLLSLPVTSAAGGSGREQQQIVSIGTTVAGVAGSLGTTTVVFANVGGSNIAQLVTSGVKGLTAQNLRAAAAAAAAASSVGGPTAVTLTSSPVNSCNTGGGSVQAGGMATFQLLTTSSAAAAAAAAALQQQQQRRTVTQARLQPATIAGHQVVGIAPNVQGGSGGRATLQRGTPITIKMATAAPGGSGVTVPSAPNSSQLVNSQQQSQVAQIQPYQQVYVNQPNSGAMLGNNDKLRRRPNLSEQQ